MFQEKKKETLWKPLPTPAPYTLPHPPTPHNLISLTREFDDVDSLSCFLLNANILATGIVCDEININNAFFTQF